MIIQEEKEDGEKTEKEKLLNNKKKRKKAKHTLDITALIKLKTKIHAMVNIQ